MLYSISYKVMIYGACSVYGLLVYHADELNLSLDFASHCQGSSHCFIFQTTYDIE